MKHHLRMLILRQGRERPDHVQLDRGVPFVESRASASALPRRFLGAARPDDPKGLPWAALVFGLETGRFNTRARFLSALNRDAEAQKPVTRFGDALAAAFRITCGGRGATHSTRDFRRFVTEALPTTGGAARQQLARGLEKPEPASHDFRIGRAKARAISFSRETGHCPADHPEVLYWLSELIDGLPELHFTQNRGRGGNRARAQLVAWSGGAKVSCQAQHLGDLVDVWSCAGFVNALLRDLLGREERVMLRVEDEGVLAVGGRPRALRRLERERLFD